MFAGHSHGPTAHLVSGCPLCDAQKEARNRAIGHLSEALNLLAGIRPEDDQATLRLNLGPIGVTSDDVHLCRSVDLTAKQAEALSDAVDSMAAYAGSEPQPHPEHELLDRYGADRDVREAIKSGEWSAAAVAQHSPDMAAAITDVFLDLDPRTITISVLDDAQATALDVNQALDSFFGEIADPYADEDDV